MSLFSNIRGVFATGVFTMALSFVNSIVISRYLGPEQRGSYVFIIAAVTLLSFLLGLGSHTATTFYGAKDRTLVPGMVRTQAVFTLAVAALLVGLLWLSLSWPPLGFLAELFVPADLSVWWGLGLVAVAFVLTQLSGLLSAVHASQRAFSTVNSGGIAYQVSLLAVGAVLLFWWGARPGWEVSVALVLLLPLMARLGALATRDVLVHFRSGGTWFSGPLFRQLVTWGSVPFLAGLFQFLNQRVDYWFIEALRGNASLGIYSLGSTLAQITWMLPTAIGTVLFPTFVGLEPAERKRLLPQLVWVALAGGLGFAVVGYVLAPWAIPLVYGRDFATTTEPFRILLLGTVAISATSVVASYFISIDRTGYNLIASAVGLLVTVVLDIVLIPRFGIVGAAWTTNASYVVTTLIVFGLVSRTGIGIKELLHIRHLLEVLRNIRRRVRSAMAARRPPPKDEDEFYTRLFTEEGSWSGREPNEDESGRWTQIQGLMAGAGFEPGGTARILEIGCGRGWMTHLLGRFGHATGIDPVANVVEYGRGTYEGIDLRVGSTPEVLDAEGQGTFDLIVSSEVLEHIMDKPPFMRDLLDLLVPGGHLVVTTPRKEVFDDFERLYGDDGMQPVEEWLSEVEIRSLFEASGFEIVDRRFFNPLPIPDAADEKNVYQAWICRKPTA